MQSGEQKAVSGFDNERFQILRKVADSRSVLKRNRHIVELCEQGFNCAEIGKYIGLTRVRVWQILRSLDLKPKPRTLTAECEICQKTFTKFRTLIVKSKRHFCSRACFNESRKAKLTASCHVCGSPCRQSRAGKRSFCSQSCYHSLRQDGRYVQSRQGQRRAHKVVSKYFELQTGNVVHHEDRNNRNNAEANLRVFRNQAEHMAYHHGADVKPIWDGRTV